MTVLIKVWFLCGFSKLNLFQNTCSLQHTKAYYKYVMIYQIIQWIAVDTEHKIFCIYSSKIYTCSCSINPTPSEITVKQWQGPVLCLILWVKHKSACNTCHWAHVVLFSIPVSVSCYFSWCSVRSSSFFSKDVSIERHILSEFRSFSSVWDWKITITLRFCFHQLHYSFPSFAITAILFLWIFQNIPPKFALYAPMWSPMHIEEAAKDPI